MHTCTHHKARVKTARTHRARGGYAHMSKNKCVQCTHITPSVGNAHTHVNIMARYKKCTHTCTREVLGMEPNMA